MPVAIVEAEKTAVIASICYPQFIWLATGSKGNLKAEKLTRLGNRRIILYPDADAFGEWQKVAQDARELYLLIVVSDLIENEASAEQRAKQYDLADYLIDEQSEVNRHNSFVDNYDEHYGSNAKQ